MAYLRDIMTRRANIKDALTEYNGGPAGRHPAYYRMVMGTYVRSARADRSEVPLSAGAQAPAGDGAARSRLGSRTGLRAGADFRKEEAPARSRPARRHSRALRSRPRRPRSGRDRAGRPGGRVRGSGVSSGTGFTNRTVISPGYREPAGRPKRRACQDLVEDRWSRSRRGPRPAGP
jgi:hypothetical protein